MKVTVGNTFYRASLTDVMSPRTEHIEGEPFDIEIDLEGSPPFAPQRMYYAPLKLLSQLPSSFNPTTNEYYSKFTMWNDDHLFEGCWLSQDRTMIYIDHHICFSERARLSQQLWAEARTRDIMEHDSSSIPRS